MQLAGKNRIVLACVAALVALAACTESKVSSGPMPPPSPCSASGLAPTPSTPVPGLDGHAVDIALAHKALVYDAARNAYYASVPQSATGSGNCIVTIDPASGQVSSSVPVGSEPSVLAISADGGSLYVGLDGSGELLKLALPSMVEQGRVRFPSDPFLSRQSHASAMVASPVDSDVVAVVLPEFGVGLLRNMVLQTRFASPFESNNVLAFDSAGTFVYTLDTSSTAEGLRRLAVLPDGLTEQAFVRSALAGAANSVFVDGGRVIAGSAFYSAPALAATGAVSGASDCQRQRSSVLLLCLTSPEATYSVRLLLADPGTFVILASLLVDTSEPGFPRSLVEGPTGQVAISYPARLGSASKIRLFSSDQMLSAPVPPPVTWPVTPSSTPDGNALDIALAHNALVYDAGRNVYYASVPGSVIGAGNSIASIDPADGRVTHSRPVGSEPSALAIAADGSVLYVALVSGELLRLALPSMAEQARVRLPFDPFFSRAFIRGIAVSPADPTVTAVMMVDSFTVRLLRDMVVQPTVPASSFGNDLLVFDTTGSTLYGLDGLSTEHGLRRFDVLADGLAEQLKVIAPTEQGVRALSFIGSRVIAGMAVYDAPGLSLNGTVSGASDCVLARAGGQLICLTTPNFPLAGPAHLLLASPDTFVISASLLFDANEAPLIGRRLLMGPAGQVAVSYPLTEFFRPPNIRLFTSAQLP